MPPARLGFIDALRGWAFVFMIFNHTAISFLGAAFDPGRIYLVYATVSLAAPLFLFLVGFSMALSHAYRAGGPGNYVYYLKRGVLLIALGFLVNALTRPDMPAFTGGILQTIGLGLICLAPLIRFMDRRAARFGLAALAVVLYLLFIAFYPLVMERLDALPLALRLFFDGFPPWPWISVTMIGLVVGSQWTSLQGSKTNLVRTIGAGGILSLVIFVISGNLPGGTISFDFRQDFIINGHWMPGPVSAFLVMGGVLTNFFFVYYLTEKVELRLGWLQVVGRSALLLYVIHLVLIRVVGGRILETQSESWADFLAISVVVFAAVLLIGQAADRWKRHGQAVDFASLS